MNLYEYNIILASGSPRRIEMLTELGAEVWKCKPLCHEVIHTALSPGQTVMSLSLKKGKWVEELLEKEGMPQFADTVRDTVLIASDTLVYCGGKMGKPVDKDDAFRMLSALRGRSHSVYSGVYLHIFGADKRVLLYDETKVFVRNCSDSWLRDYIATGEPMDKAGAYAIQGLFASQIERYEGHFDTVVGFPLEKIKEMNI